MTKNERDVRCKRTLCYGIVKKYTADGPRDPPEDLQQSKYSPLRLVKLIFYKLRGKDEPMITWYECSVCHTRHPELE